MVGDPLLLFLSAVTASQPALSARESDVQRTVVEFFDALARKDRAKLSSLVVADGSVSAISDEATRPSFRRESWEQWMARIAASPQLLQERMYRPRIRKQGSLASLWAEYDFWRDGRFSHCGVDNFDLARIDGQWRIVNLSFTIQTKGCPRSPKS